MDALSLVAIVENVRYKKGWSLSLFFPNTYIQLSVKGHCSLTGLPTIWKSGKRYISGYATEQEIVGTCFSLIKDAEDHEMREFFRYKGRAIYNPHLNVNALVDLASKKENFDTRPDSMTRA